MTTRSSLVGFFCWAYALSWVCWIPAAAAVSGDVDLPLTQPLTLLGQFGPCLAALLMTYLEAGKTGLWKLGGSLLNWKVHPIWYVVALLLPPASFLGAIGVGWWIHGTTLPIEPPRLVYDILLNFIVILFIGGPLGEELGWRGFALPRLQDERGPLAASLVLAVAWAGWHLPIWLMAGAFKLPAFALYVVGTIPLTILFTWLFNRTNGSVLLAMLFHGSINTFYVILPIEPSFPIWVVLLWSLAVVVVLFQRRWFSRGPRAGAAMTDHCVSGD